MPRRMFNWKFADVDRFLRENNFRIDHGRTNGSHYFYHGYINRVLRIVHVPFHGSGTIKSRTMKSIIAQSGVSKEEWFS